MNTVTIRGKAVANVTLAFDGFVAVDENYYRNELIDEYQQWLVREGLNPLSADELVAELCCLDPDAPIVAVAKDFLSRFEKLERMIDEQFTPRMLREQGP